MTTQISLGHRYSTLDKRDEFFVYCDSTSQMVMYTWLWFYIGAELKGIKVEIIPYPIKDMKVLKTCKLTDSMEQGIMFANLIKKQLLKKK
jgi:hypothetical protein